jgi:hypothetical protein
MGRPPIGAKPMTSAQRQAAFRARQAARLAALLAGTAPAAAPRAVTEPEPSQAKRIAELEVEVSKLQADLAQVRLASAKLSVKHRELLMAAERPPIPRTTVEKYVAWKEAAKAERRARKVMDACPASDRDVTENPLAPEPENLDAIDVDNMGEVEFAAHMAKKRAQQAKEAAAQLVADTALVRDLMAKHPTWKRRQFYQTVPYRGVYSGESRNYWKHLLDAEEAKRPAPEPKPKPTEEEIAARIAKGKATRAIAAERQKAHDEWKKGEGAHKAPRAKLAKVTALAADLRGEPNTRAVAAATAERLQAALPPNPQDAWMRPLPATAAEWDAAKATADAKRKAKRDAIRTKEDAEVAAERDVTER